MTIEPLKTEKEVASLLNISARSVKNARTSGALPYVKIGRLVRFRDDDIEQFLASAIVANEPATLLAAPRRRRGRPIGSSNRTDKWGV